MSMLAIRRLPFNHHMNKFLEQAYLGAKNANSLSYFKMEYDKCINRVVESLD